MVINLHSDSNSELLDITVVESVIFLPRPETGVKLESTSRLVGFPGTQFTPKIPHVLITKALV